MSNQKTTIISGVLGLLVGAYVGTVSTLVLLRPYQQAISQNPVMQKTSNKPSNEVFASLSNKDLRPPPKFTDETPDELKTDEEGAVRILWSAVENAKRYQINLYSEDGKKIKIWKTPKHSLYLSSIPYNEDLQFTPYSITMQTMNEKDVPGPESAPKKLLARRLKSIVAPTIKSISADE